VPLRCVIVDDNPSVLVAARGLLERQGIGVVGVATNADGAMRSVADLRPDVVLVDITLGQESGVDLARQLDESGRFGDRAVILVSTHAEADIVELIGDGPALAFLPKAELPADAIRRIVRARPGS
jgi:DNA-binding NarL/FixJ family response regulator